MSDWQDTQQGKRALDALPTIASELKKIRVILADAYKEDEEDEEDEEKPQCTCSPIAYGKDCPIHGDSCP